MLNGRMWNKGEDAGGKVNTDEVTGKDEWESGDSGMSLRNTEARVIVKHMASNIIFKILVELKSLSCCIASSSSTWAECVTGRKPASSLTPASV